MDITDLEFIRDFCNDLDMLRADIGDFAECMDNNYDIPVIYKNFVWSIFHQAELVEKILNTFKEEVDAKNWEVWKQAYPQMTDKDSGPPKVQEGITQAVAKTLKEQEDFFSKIDERFNKIQGELNDQ